MKRAPVMCGNVTILGRLRRGERSAFPGRARHLLRKMIDVSQMRGAQSGGAAIQVQRRQQPEHVVRKTMNPKRGDLAERLDTLLARAAGKRAAFDGSFVLQAHVRYATAGLSTAHEAHPFCFVSPAQRGARRILRWVEGRPTIAERPIETTLTHNGDMDGWRLRGVRLAYPELGAFLGRVLGVPNPWSGDSPVLAGALELFVTQGMWLESMRLAYQLCVAPPPPELSQLPAELQGSARAREVQRMLALHPAPTLQTLKLWSSVAEHAWSATDELVLAGANGSFRQRLVARLVAQLERCQFPELPPEHQEPFSRAAVDAFLDNGLFMAVRKLAEVLEGTFGCVVTSTLEPGTAVAFSRGQPLAVGFNATGGMVAIVSERAALKVKGADGRRAFTERLDLDICHGEIACIEIKPRGQSRLTVFSIAEGREYGKSQLEAAARLISLEANPYVAPLPQAPTDRVGTDLQDVAPLLRGIRDDWRNPRSNNIKTARAFAQALLDARRPRLLVLGVTNDLWLSQQFVHSLERLFPGVVAEAKSSNEVLRDIEHTPWHAGTIVLAVSQSGQDFPTLAALLSLQERAGFQGSQSFFVLCGETDTLMGEAVGQRFHHEAAFSARVFTNGSGFRPAEAATVTVNATHHTFVELLLFLASRAQDARYLRRPPHGFSLAASELAALYSRRDFTVDRQAPAITSDVALASASESCKRLHRQARRFSQHVLEGVLAFVAAIAVLQLNLQFGLGLEPARLLKLLPRPEQVPALSAWRLLDVLGTQANVLFYAFLAPCLVWALRALQGRSPLHRQGPRELLIGDTRYVHQIAWFLARKLLSLSYGFASIKPYSADNQDELILTHEPLRGTLALFGLPDTGRQHLRARATAAAMTAKQFNGSRCLAGSGAEVVTISHTPHPPGAGLHAHIALPQAPVASHSPLLDALLEDLFDSWERLLGMQVFLNRLAQSIASLWAFSYDRSRTKDQVFAATTASPVSAAALYQLLAQTRERFGHFERELPLAGSTWAPESAPRVRTLTWPGAHAELPSRRDVS